MLFPLVPLALAFCAPSKKQSPVKQHPYTLVASRADKQGASWVTLKVTRRGRALWKRRIYGYDSSLPQWSKNYRALLIDNGGQFLIWRAGYPLLTVSYVAIPGSDGKDHYDYTMGSEWSPDGRRLLASFGISGMGDMGYSRMFCLTFKGNRYKYTLLPYPGYVRDMGWRSNTLAFYRPAEGLGGQTTGKPRLWRVP